MPIDLFDIGLICPPFDLDDLPDLGEPSVDEYAALRAYLKGLPQLAELSDVYWGEMGTRGMVYPLLIIDPITNVRTLITKESGYDELELQFTTLARYGGDAYRLGEAAWNALRPTEGNPKLRFDGGYEMNKIPGARYGPYKQPGQGPDGKPIWGHQFGVRFMIGRDD